MLDELSLPAPKTKEVARVLKALQLQGVTTLLAIPEHDLNIYKSARNIAGVTVQPVAELNALTVLRPRRMLVTRAALDAIRSRVTPRSTRTAEEGTGEL